MRFMLGFIEGPLHVQGLRTTVFQHDEIVPVAAPDHPLLKHKALTASDLAGEPLLMREHGSGTRELIASALQHQHIEPGEIMEFGNTEALKRAAVHGGGIAWLPRICMLAELRTGQLRELPLPELTITRPLMMVQRESAQMEPAAEAFVRLLRQPSDTPA